ncbi:MAG TPA: ATP-binding protein [Candidatus Saccharimonadales bacterium]|nr:ATP-binding protein [Candidatus Saccharimonadales bacterium]
MSKNNWHVITGGPSTGKTTLLAELEKMGYHTIPEAARTVIDDALGRGATVEDLRRDEKWFQEEVTRLKQKIELTHDSSILTFFDRGMQDTIAFLRYYNFDVEKWVQKLADTSHYQNVFLLQALPTYEEDYARVEDEDFRKNIQGLLHDAYADSGINPIIVHAGTVKDRAEFILHHLKPEDTI